jgi:hypothetical protein
MLRIQTLILTEITAAISDVTVQSQSVVTTDENVDECIHRLLR